MAAMHLQNASHSSSTNSHVRILPPIAVDYSEFRAEFRATLSSVVMPVTLADDRFSNEFKSSRAGNCWGGHSAVQRMC